MTVAFQTLIQTEHRDIDLELLEGRWPDDIHGEVFISAPETINETPSVLFGPGRLIRLSLRPGTHGAGTAQHAWTTWSR